MRKPIVIVVSVVVGLIFLGMFLSLLGGSMLFNCGSVEMESVRFTEQSVEYSGFTSQFEKKSSGDGGYIYFEIKERSLVSHKIEVKINNTELYVTYKIVKEPENSWGGTHTFGVKVYLDSKQLARISKVRIVGDISQVLYEKNG